jgi:hypothetical protein
MVVLRSALARDQQIAVANPLAPAVPPFSKTSARPVTTLPNANHVKPFDVAAVADAVIEGI